MVKNIYNSSGKVIGTIDVLENKIIVRHNQKPELVITDDDVIKIALSRKFCADVIIKLFDEYTLLIGEIAAIFDVHYHVANKWVLSLPTKTSKKTGRRNSSYGQTFKPPRLKNMSDSQKGKAIYHNQFGEKAFKIGEPIPEGYVKGRFPFSDEVKAKLAQIIKDKKQSGEMLSPREVARKGWRNGKFKNVNFKRGIGGYITSIKTGKRFFFRSLLELYYILRIEEDPTVEIYQYEPFHILCDNGTSYTPDFLINNHQVIELKSYKFVYSQGGDIQEKFEYKISQAKKYCEEHGFEFKVIFDKDLGFDSNKFKHLLTPDLIRKYRIQLLQPERVWSKKQQNG